MKLLKRFHVSVKSPFIFGIISVFVFLFFSIGTVVLSSPFWIHRIPTQKLKPRLESWLTYRLGGKVQLDELHFGLTPEKNGFLIELGHFTFLNALNRPILETSKGQLQVPFLGLLRAKPEVRFQLKYPKLTVEHQVGESWNIVSLFQSQLKPSQSSAVRLASVPQAFVEAQLTVSLEQASVQVIDHENQVSVTVPKLDLNFAQLSWTGESNLSFNAQVNYQSKVLDLQGPISGKIDFFPQWKNENGRAAAKQFQGLAEQMTVDAKRLSIDLNHVNIKAAGTPLIIEQRGNIDTEQLEVESAVFKFGSFVESSQLNEVFAKGKWHFRNPSALSASVEVKKIDLGSWLGTSGGLLSGKTDIQGELTDLRYSGRFNFSNVALPFVNSALIDPVQLALPWLKAASMAGEIELNQNDLRLVQAKISDASNEITLAGNFENAFSLFGLQGSNLPDPKLSIEMFASPQKFASQEVAVNFLNTALLQFGKLRDSAFFKTLGVSFKARMDRLSIGGSADSSSAIVDYEKITLGARLENWIGYLDQLSFGIVQAEFSNPAQVLASAKVLFTMNPPSYQLGLKVQDYRLKGFNLNGVLGFEAESLGQINLYSKTDPPKFSGKFHIEPVALTSFDARTELQNGLAVAMTEVRKRFPDLSLDLRSNVFPQAGLALSKDLSLDLGRLKEPALFKKWFGHFEYQGNQWTADPVVGVADRQNGLTFKGRAKLNTSTGSIAASLVFQDSLEQALLAQWSTHVSGVPVSPLFENESKKQPVFYSEVSCTLIKPCFRWTRLTEGLISAVEHQVAEAKKVALKQTEVKVP